jgi:anti-anti-sigma regulatory factor
VDCRIEIADLADRRLIRLAGRLTAAQVHELRVASRGGPRVVHLDLSELVSLDAAGLEVLDGLQHEGARLLQVPAYIQLKLDTLSAKRRRRKD